jgi:hypothetical protein
MTALLDRRYLATTPTQLPADYLVAGDLCDIRVGRGYCHHTATSAAVDADGQHRILCAVHTAMYFPSR